MTQIPDLLIIYQHFYCDTSGMTLLAFVYSAAVTLFQVIKEVSPFGYTAVRSSGSLFQLARPAY